MNIRKELLKHQDLKYKDFTAKLIPNIDPETIIGVRAPIVGKLAKELFKEGNYQDFINDLPHKYYEEYGIHTCLVSLMKNYDECIAALNKYLPYVNNWANCDSIKPNVFNKHKKELMREIKVWLKSKHTYTIRFGISMLMGYYLDEDFDPKHLQIVAKIKSDEYYVNMMRAWYFATALAKQKEETMKLIESKSLDAWTHNKTIQKARESYRISDEDKAYLKTLKV